MSSLYRAALSVALMVMPLLVTGCAQTSRQTVYCPPTTGQTSVTSVGDGKVSLARQEEIRGNLSQAKLLYEEMYRREPGNVDYAHRLGVVCTRLNLHQEAESYLRQALAKAPNNAELLADMGYAAFMRKDYALAEQRLEQSVKLNGSNPRAVNNLAIAKAWCGKDDASLALFRIVYNTAEAQQRLQAIQVARGGQTPARELPTTNVVELPPSPSPAAPEFLAKYKPLDVKLPSSEFTLPVPIAENRVSDEEVDVPPSPSVFIELTTHTAGNSAAEVQIQLPQAGPVLPVEMNELANTLELETVFGEESIQIPAPQPIEKSEVATEPALTTVEIAEQLPTIVVPDATEVGSTPAPVAAVSSDPVVDAVAPTKTRESRPLVLTTWRKTPQVERGRGEVRSIHWTGDAARRAISTDTTVFDENGVCQTCLVTLFEESRIVPGVPSQTFEYQSRKYQFSSVDAMKKFQAAPQKYAPVAGGLDVVSIRNERRAIQGTLRFGLWHRQQLYLFSCRENLDEFFREPAKFVAIDK